MAKYLEKHLAGETIFRQDYLQYLMGQAAYHSKIVNISGTTPPAAHVAAQAHLASVTATIGAHATVWSGLAVAGAIDQLNVSVRELASEVAALRRERLL